MSYKSLTIEFSCNKCKCHNDFIDGLNNCGMRPERCNDFELKFIKNIDNNNVEYTVSFKCKKCKKFGTVSFNIDKNKISNKDIPIKKSYKCCEAEILINAILLYDDEEENNDEKKDKIKKAKEKNKNIKKQKEKEYIQVNNNIKFY